MFSKIKIAIILCLISLSIVASHNRAGEITYKRIAPFKQMVGGEMVDVFTYSITITIYTNFSLGSTNVADRCQDTIYFGDGEREILKRLNGTGPMQSCTCSPQCGEIMINQANYRVKKNIYATTHTYPGAGTYTIHTTDRARNENVENVPNSGLAYFYIEAVLKITSFTGANSSPVFTFPPLDKACLGECFYHNPGAYDPDKDDSLSYELTLPRGAGGTPLPGAGYPNENTSGIYTIDNKTGLISWCSPPKVAEYNLAFFVYEWRKNTSGVYEIIGSVLRDMQVIVEACPNNKPPLITLPADTCVEAGTIIDKYITVSDPDSNQVVTLTGGGGAFNTDPQIATISPTTGLIKSTTRSYKSHFVWKTNCNHVRNLPYLTTFKAIDNGQPSNLVYFKTYSIKVYPSSVKNVTAVPSSSSMKISWSLSTCNPANNPLVAYKVYRKNDCNPEPFETCKTGINYSNFTLVATTSPAMSSAIDDNFGQGLVVGQNYGYVVIAQFADGLETFGSTQVCAKLIRDVPVIINVDVLSTSTSTGSILINWIRPLKTKGNFDTLSFPGPYQFVLKHKKQDGTTEEIFTSQKNFLYQLDTTFIQKNLNTQDFGHEYFVDFYANAKLVGSSRKANSVFVQLSASDRKINVTWNNNMPWTNKLVNVYRKNPTTSSYTLIGTTTSNSYLDTKNIANRNTYCYKVQTSGAYSDTNIPQPLINNSQESCTLVKDLTPPCTATISIDADCPLGDVSIKWLDLRKTCDSSDDVVSYDLYFKPVVSDEYYKIETLNNTKTSYELHDLQYISGCYAVSAIDSSGNKGKLSFDFCVDNCPEFELPNIFTPNGDGVNDNFQAVKVRQIKEIDLNIYDRWGNLVYKTKDPLFKWDGKSIISKKQVSDGTVFYTCIIYEPRVSGLNKRTLKGYVQILN